MNGQSKRLCHINPFIIGVALLLAASAAQASPLPGPLVETDWLANNLSNVVILDVRADQESFIKKQRGGIAGIQACGGGGSGGGASNVSGHIPGAAFVPWEQMRADRQEGDTKILGELPKASVFQRWMTRSGVGQDSAVVIAGLGERPSDVVQATRVYWTLRYFGHDNVAVLNGGTAKWAAEDREMEFGRSRAKKGNFKAGPGRPELLASTADVQEAAAGAVQLVDVRAQDVYLGLTYHREFVQPHAKGHIPGAKSFPFTLLIDTMGPSATFYTAEQLRELSGIFGVDPSKPTIVYCETGGQASVTWFAFHELLGNKNVRIYDGSMNEWSSDKSRPVVSMQFE
jgi:thiosulfate/3-mercaptopyruvate sulfurtransferase